MSQTTKQMLQKTTRKYLAKLASGKYQFNLLNPNSKIAVKIVDIKGEEVLVVWGRA